MEHSPQLPKTQHPHKLVQKQIGLKITMIMHNLIKI